MSKTGKSLWAVDAIKVFAAQFILIHHMVAYGPMSWTLYPVYTELFDWIFEYGRMAVLAFLVVGGFLAAKSMVPSPGELKPVDSLRALAQLLRSRYLRLAPPYLLAIGLTIFCAFVVRQLVDDPDTPTPATFAQWIAHIFLVQDLVGIPALTAGAWYVAIDFQLYGLLAMVLWGCSKAPLRHRAGWVSGAVMLLTATSLLWANLSPELDPWAIYFFGAYGLGVLTQWSSKSRTPWLWMGVTALLVVAALALEWRARIAVAAGTALVLIGLNVLQARRRLTLPTWLARSLQTLSDKSYTLFLVHYSVILLVGGVVTYYFAGNVSAAMAGMAAIWLLSMAGSWGLHGLTHTLMQRWVK